MKFRKFRGYGLKYYLLVSGFGVASSFYIFRPILDVIEKRNAAAEIESALTTIEKAKGR